MSKKNRVWSLRLVLMILAALLQTNSLWADTLTLSGNVMDEKTEKPVAGAKVELTNANSGTGYFVTNTDPDGKFSFTNVRPGVFYDLAVLADGYCPYQMSRWSFPDNQNAVDLKIPLVQGSIIRGKVTVSDGAKPISNAHIQLILESGDFQVLRNEESLFTDAEGKFSFAQMPPNQYRLSISYGGYITEQIVNIRPQPGEQKEYNVKLFRPASLSGFVALSENGSPLPDIEVAARGASQQVGSTDPNGFFTIGSLKPGTYQLQSRPAGFRPYDSTQAIQLQEGENLSDLQVRMRPLAPSLSVSLPREVFLPEEDLVFQMRTFRIGRYQCEIHQVPVSVFLTDDSNLKGLVGKEDLSPFQEVLHWTVDVDFRNPFVWIDRNIKAPQHLAPGAYILRASSPEDKKETRVLFFVTELGIVVKRGEHQTFVYATDLKSNMPVEGTKIRVVSRSSERKKSPGWTETLLNQPLEKFTWHGETDKQGVALIQHDYPDTSSADIIAISPNGYMAVSQLIQSSLIHSEGGTVFPYTDRPVYRLGQTLYFKSIFRDKEDRNYKIPANQSVSVEIRDPENNSCFSAELTTNEWGSVNGSYEIPSTAPLGQYSLEASSEGGVRRTIPFFVEQYRKPEFKVDVTPEKSFYINGDELAFSIHAEYYFGAPVPNAEVRYRLYESLASGGESHSYPSAYSRFLSSGETRTDAEGMARVDFIPQRSSQDRQVTMEVDITEASGRRVSGSAAVPVGVGDYYLTVRPTQYVFDRETPLAVEIQSRSHDNKPISVSVNVDFLQEVWNPVRRRYERPSRPQASKTVVTDENGKARVEWLPDTDLSGRIEVNVLSTDSKKNRITALTRLWRMASDFGSFEFQYPTLEGILDKDSYKPGEEATLLINTTDPQNPVILTIEGRDILSYQVIWPAGNTTKIKIPVLPEYAPNVYVYLFMPRGKTLSSRQYDLNIPEKRGDLVMELQPDRDKYKPGEQGTIAIKTRLPDGKPVAAEVSVAVVDEAIFAIRSDRTPNIHSIFYDRQSNWVVTTLSFPLQYYGGANKGVQPDIRKDFRDTALWVADAYTNENGEGQVTVTYPDNLTTWRITSRAHTRDTEVGMAKSKTLVTKDIVARLSLPRFFVESDQTRIPSFVNNLSQDNLPNIQLRLDAQGGVNLKEPNQKTTQAAAGAVARESWNVEVTSASPAATFVLEASSVLDRDALQLTVPVLPLGYEENQFQSGTIEQPETSLSQNIGEDIVLSESKINLQWTPSLAAVALGAMPYLTTFPYGCTEQTLNGFLPDMILLNALNELKMLSEKDQGKMQALEKSVKEGLQRLYTLQKESGGWGWFPEGNEDLWITGLAIHGLHIADRLGYSVDVNRLDRGIQYLRENLAYTRDWDMQSYGTWILSELDDQPLAYLDELYTNRNELYDSSLAWSAMALFNRKKEKEAGEVLDLLLSRITKINDQQSAWEISPDALWRWNGTAAETSAAGLSALVQVRGLNGPVDSIVSWLLAQRWGDHWRSTRETAAVVEALCGVIKAQAAQEQVRDVSYNLAVNQETIQSGTLAVQDFTHPLSIPLKLKTGVNTIQLHMDHPVGNWSLQNTLFHHGEINQPVPHDALNFSRMYERAIHTKDYMGRPKIMTDGFSPDDLLPVGQEILVSLVIETKQDIPYLIIEDPLPSGCEVIESFLHLTDEYWLPFTRYERHDQKMVFFLESVGKGETRVEYLIRTEMDGVFHANPAHAWSMYYPDVSAISASNRISVK